MGFRHRQTNQTHEAGIAPDDSEENAVTTSSDHWVIEQSRASRCWRMPSALYGVRSFLALGRPIARMQPTSEAMQRPPRPCNGNDGWKEEGMWQRSSSEKTGQAIRKRIQKRIQVVVMLVKPRLQ